MHIAYWGQDRVQNKKHVLEQSIVKKKSITLEEVMETSFKIKINIKLQLCHFVGVVILFFIQVLTFVPACVACLCLGVGVDV